MKTIAASSAALGTSLILLSGLIGPEADRSSAPLQSAAEALVASAPMTEADFNEVIQETCVRCHSDRRMTGNLSLEGFDVARAPERAEAAERVVRKLRAGMMPPRGAAAPAGDTLVQLAVELENVLDRAAAANPNPGHRPFQRMNRPEYQAAISDLLGLEVDAGEWLPLDPKSNNFDNIAVAQTLSPMLLESYLNAAAAISRMAVGDRNAPAVDVTYKNSEYVSQHPWDHVEGAPYGTRGGIVVNHVFPADGQYTFAMSSASGDNTKFEDVDVSIDGERVALLAFSRIGQGADGRGAQPIETDPISVRAGQHRISAAFIRRAEGPYEDLIRPHDWSNAGGGSGGGGITTLPHIRDLVIGGPVHRTGISDNATRQKIFTCRPTVPSEEAPCARSIVERLAADAYRRPVESGEIDDLVWFYEDGAEKGGFEIGVRTALEAILASPYFVLRLERQTDADAPISALADLDLASRLSFFIWGTPPDAELLEVAEAGRLSDQAELERQTRRMLQDRRSEALGTRFAAQWLRLQDLYKVRPDPNFYPNFDENLADDMYRETVMFFNNLVREDRNVLEMFSAEYTFVNERLARHYGIPGVAGSQMRRVDYPADMARSGLFGQGSVLVLTSLANRTSPVLRGKWVMEVLLGTPPPPPPPNVPTLDESVGDAVDGQMLTTRQRMEMHRKNPTCASCHGMIDPIGLALDNFDVTGKWRMRENGMALDTRGDYYDGTQIANPAELAQVVLKRPLPLVRSFTENLMAFAIGRRVEYFDRPTIRQIVRDAEDGKGGYHMSALIMGVVKSDAFGKRAGTVSADQAGH